jgi:hypothetical protein
MDQIGMVFKDQELTNSVFALCKNKCFSTTHLDLTSADSRTMIHGPAQSFSYEQRTISWQIGETGLEPT